MLFGLFDLDKGEVAYLWNPEVDYCNCFIVDKFNDFYEICERLERENAEVKEEGVVEILGDIDLCNPEKVIAFWDGLGEIDLCKVLEVAEGEIG